MTLTSSGAGAGAHAGSYDIVPSAAVAGNGTDLANYAITYANGTLTVSKADQRIAFSVQSDASYGDPDVDPGATADSGLPVSYGTSGACSIVSGKVHLTGAGSCTVTASQAGNGDYNAASDVQRSFSIAKAPLTITANDRQKTYGQSLSLGSTAFSTSGLVGSDSVSAVTLSSSGAGSAAHAGTYPIVPSAAVAGNGTDLSNYTITYGNGTLTVGKADQSITFGAINDHTYGDADFDPGATASSGLDVSYGASGACSIASGKVHMPSIGLCTITASQPGNSDYNAASDVQHSFSIGKAALTITANDRQKTYGQTLNLGSSAFTPSGLVGSDSIAAVTLASSGTAAAAHVGTYPIVASAAVAGNGTDLGNYTVTYANGTLTVGKADQSITFPPINDRTWGAADFDPGASADSGLAVAYGASGKCSIVSGKVHITGAGSCTVTASQAGNSDYNAAPNAQRSFTINTASLTVRAIQLKQKIVHFYSGDLRTAFTTSGLVNGDSVASVTMTSAGMPADAPAGDYPLVPSAAVAGLGTDLSNYTIHYVSGTLRVINAGIVGLSSVSIVPLTGTVDSFDSSNGAYGGSNHGSAALILSNGTVSVGDLTVKGSVISTQGNVRLTTKKAVVTGNVTAGTTVTNPGTIGGTVTQNSPSPAIDAPTVSSCSPYSNSNGISGGKFVLKNGDLTIVSGTVTLANGTYCFHNVLIGTDTTLRVTGPVTINVNGTWSSATAKILNTTDNPTKLHINSSYAGANGVAMKSSAHAYETLVAPYTDVAIVKGPFFGRVLANTVKVTGKGTSIHQDVH